MTVRITIDARQVEEMARRFGNSQPVVRAIRTHHERAGVLLRDNARRRAPRDRGGLQADIRLELFTKLEAAPFRVVAESRVVTDLPYSAPMESGTRPFWPPVAPLKTWAVRHGMPARAGYAIQRVIAKRGLKPRLYMEKGRTASRRAISADAKRMAADLGTAWSK